MNEWQNPTVCRYSWLLSKIGGSHSWTVKNSPYNFIVTPLYSQFHIHWFKQPQIMCTVIHTLTERKSPRTYGPSSSNPYDSKINCTSTCSPSFRVWYVDPRPKPEPPFHPFALWEQNLDNRCEMTLVKQNKNVLFINLQWEVYLLTQMDIPVSWPVILFPKIGYTGSWGTTGLLRDHWVRAGDRCCWCGFQRPSHLTLHLHGRT